MPSVRAWWLTRPDSRAVWFTVDGDQADIFRGLGWETVRVVALDDVYVDPALLTEG